MVVVLFYVLYAKTPVGMLVFLGIAATRVRAASAKHIRQLLFVIVLSLVIFLFVSSQTGFSVHGRYIIPTLTFIIVFSSSVVNLDHLCPPLVCRLVIMCCSLIALESSYVFPHSLSFFNVLSGGSVNGYMCLADSNISWGQDLYVIAEWFNRHDEVKSVKMMHYGSISPAVVGISFEVPKNEDVEVDASSGIRRLRPGWYAIDVNYLAGSMVPCITSTGGRDFSAAMIFPWKKLRDLKPHGYIGYTMRVYYIP